MKSYEQAAEFLPADLRPFALSLPSTEKRLCEELRLRVGQPISVTLPDGEYMIPGSLIISSGDLHSVLEIATRSSIHTALDRVRNGFVTVQGGHRVGLCGAVTVKEGAVHNLNDLSSINIRIARQLKGIADPVLRQLRAESDIGSVLILAPPGAGKTTMLRDLIRGLSSGIGGKAMRIGVADERGELAAVYRGIPQMDLGPHTDVMDGCSKADGLMMLLRGMNPQILVVDEITAPGDIDALELAAGCGVTLFATAHGRCPEDLRRRPLYANLLERKVFQKVILIEQLHGVRQYRLEALPC